MEITTLLARVFGPYLLLAALMVFFNRKVLIENVNAMFQERFAQWLAAMIALLGGLAYVNLYQDYSSLPSSILSIVGWLIFAKGLIYAFLPQVRLAKFTKVLNENSWYTTDGVLAFVFGIYLTGFGYGFW